MGAIYKSQIQWNAPDGHKFSAQPVRDYIAQGLEQVGAAAQQVSQSIQVEQNQIAVDRMKQAGVEAQSFIDNFEDFSGDDYMDKMVSGAMEIWNNAYAQMDEATARRFEMNNPEATSVFNFKVQEAAVEKSYNHAYTQAVRNIPNRASAIVALGDPNAIKAAMQEEVYRASQEDGMRAEDLEKYIDTLQYDIAQGAIAQAIGEGRAEDAAALNNDLQFTNRLTPSQRASNNAAIQQLLKAKAEATKKADIDEDKVLRESLTKSLVAVGDEMYRMAGTNDAAKEDVTLAINKMLNDFSEGDIAASYNGIPIDVLFPEYKAFVDAPYSIRQKVVKDVYGELLENSPTDRRMKAEIGWRAASKLAGLDEDESGTVEVSELQLEDMAEIGQIVTDSDNFYAYDDSIDAVLDPLRQVWMYARDRAEYALQFSAYQEADTPIAQRTGLGWSTEQYSYSGNLSPEVMQVLRERKDDPHGLTYSAKLDEARQQAISNLAYWTNGGKLPDNGTYREMIYQQAVDFAFMPEEEKKKLGLEYVTNRQIIDNLFRQAAQYDREGILDSAVDNTKGLVRPASEAASTKEMSPAERARVTNTYLISPEGVALKEEFKRKHNVTDGIVSILASEGKIDDSFVGKLMGPTDEIPKEYNGSVLGKMLYSAMVSTGAVSSGKPLLKSKIDELNADWKKEVLDPIDSVLRQDARYRSESAKDAYIDAAGLRGSPEAIKIVQALRAGSPADRVPMAKSIYDTDYYRSIVDSIMFMNNGANPNSEDVAAMAASIRRSVFPDNFASRAVHGDWSSKATSARKDTRAYTVPLQAGAVGVKY